MQAGTDRSPRRPGGPLGPDRGTAPAGGPSEQLGLAGRRAHSPSTCLSRSTALGREGLRAEPFPDWFLWL